jgi:hypothetical protein
LRRSGASAWCTINDPDGLATAGRLAGRISEFSIAWVNGFSFSQRAAWRRNADFWADQ